VLKRDEAPAEFATPDTLLFPTRRPA